jgi:hypothetical protein
MGARTTDVLSERTARAQAWCPLDAPCAAYSSWPSPSRSIRALHARARSDGDKLPAARELTLAKTNTRANVDRDEGVPPGPVYRDRDHATSHTYSRCKALFAALQATVIVGDLEAWPGDRSSST